MRAVVRLLILATGGLAWATTARALELCDNALGDDADALADCADQDCGLARTALDLLTGTVWFENDGGALAPPPAGRRADVPSGRSAGTAPQSGRCPPSPWSPLPSSAASSTGWSGWGWTATRSSPRPPSRPPRCRSPASACRGVWSRTSSRPGLTGDTRIGFHFATSRAVAPTTLPELMLFACGTVREGLDRVAAVARLWGDAERWSPTDGWSRVRYTVVGPPRRAHVHLHEHGLALPSRTLEHLLGARLRMVEVRFAHPRDGDTSAYDAWFGCPVRFGAGVTEAVLEPDQLDQRIATGNPVFLRYFAGQAEAELASLPAVRTQAERLRVLLAEALAARGLGACSLESSAAALRQSPRTLQRALSREGTSFAAELDALRRAEAERLLAIGLDIAEISWRLGYAEPSVFHRAFKRWTGATPDRFRRAP